MKPVHVIEKDTVKITKIKNSNAPSAIDWDEKGYVSPVKNQLACGSCWAFATTGMLESRFAILTNTTGKENIIQLSEQQIMDCSKPFGNNACGGGNIRNSIDYLSKHTERALLSESSYPYILEYENDLYAANGAPCRTASDIDKDKLNLLPLGTIAGWKGLTTENEIEMEVVTNGPVTIAIDANMTIFQH